MKILNSVLLVFVLILFSCKKQSSTANYFLPIPSFIVTGLSDITVVNSHLNPYYITLTVKYMDSAQSKVKLTYSGFPTGISLDTMTWKSNAYPNFTSGLYVYDTTTMGAVPGTYPITFTAIDDNGNTKQYTINLTVKSEPNCSAMVAGIYNYCATSCNGNIFKDSVYADATVVDKIWFNNFANTGKTVYGIINCFSSHLVIPNQTIGDTVFNGYGTFYTNHRINFSAYNNGNLCSINMN